MQTEDSEARVEGIRAGRWAVLSILLWVCVLACAAMRAEARSGNTAASLESSGKDRARFGREITPRDIISVNTVIDVKLSPNGEEVLYELRRTDWDENHYLTELWLVATTPGATPRKLVNGASSTSAYRSIKASWQPDGEAIVYFASRGGDYQLWQLDLNTGKEHALTDFAEWEEFDPRRRQGTAMAWSPDGSRAALVVQVIAPAFSGQDSGSAPTRGQSVDVYWPDDAAASPGQLWVIDLDDESATRITDDTVSVHDVAWSPDSRRMVISATDLSSDGRDRSPHTWVGLDSDLYLVDPAERSLTSLVVQPGWDRQPGWSPDGRWIAFESQRGVKDWNYSSFVAVAEVETGRVSYLDEDSYAIRGSAAANLVWDSRSEGVYFTALYHGRRPLFHVGLDGTVRQITTDDAYYRSYSLAPEKNVVAMSGERIAVPGEVYVSRLDEFAPRKLTDLNADWPTAGLPPVDGLEWTSFDGLAVHGHVLLPPGYRKETPLPTIIFSPGGPSMARLGFQFDESFYPFLTWATRGYAVFVPNNRGRGGWGYELRNAMPEHSDYLPGPYRDVMAGIDFLIQRGITDPDRIGLAGFSFGACLAGYAITQTNRFRAASINEGYWDFVHRRFAAAGQLDSVQRARDQAGMGLPWDPGALENLMRQSPIYYADRIRTPTLLEYGALSLAESEGTLLFGALRHFGVPSELIVYPRTGHGTEEPLLLLDSFKRNLHWFDRWLNEAPEGSSR